MLSNFHSFFYHTHLAYSLPDNIVNQCNSKNPFTVYVETISANIRCIDICIDTQWVVKCLFDDDDDNITVFTISNDCPTLF